MKKNERFLDRVIRVGIGAITGAIARETTGPVSKAMWAISAIMLGTAATGFCPLYRVFGISTCKVS
ncbi:YgaP family membrane protein [Corynebacterium freiburgense]|uniref:YgaP family membrane protein n=1 Tax=Corynebacterium freiburgense TaxID=556548 RepID=UPI00041A457A|nr:DUF2892 domain-containing protein [Corynebacterium freiburgense]WJZ03132.1 hypothetical protein CFREI_09270 [Corynebacterium freiburgense]